MSMAMEASSRICLASLSKERLLEAARDSNLSITLWSKPSTLIASTIFLSPLLTT
jgi:hypothetical protein